MKNGWSDQGWKYPLIWSDFLCQPYLVQPKQKPSACNWLVCGFFCFFGGGVDLNKVWDHWCKLNNHTVAHLKGSTLEWFAAVVKAAAAISVKVVFTFPVLLTGGELLKLWVGKISGKLGQTWNSDQHVAFRQSHQRQSSPAAPSPYRRSPLKECMYNSII